MITSDTMLRKLRLHIHLNYYTQREAAKNWGVSDAYVSSVCRGEKKPSQAILNELGLDSKTTKTTVYFNK